MTMLEKLARNNGETNYNGEHYTLTQMAYLKDDSTYTALAIRSNDERDEDGYQTAYTITWSISNPEAEDEGDACDWDNPLDVTDEGILYNIDTGYHC